MKQSLFAFLICLIGLSSAAYSAVHIDLSVNVNMNKRILEISGTASQPVNLPNNMHKVKEFSYNFPLPAAQDVVNWKNGPFGGEREFYLPAYWHPQADDLITFDVKLTSPLVGVAPGKISNEQQTKTSYQARFVMDQPTESIPLFIGPYKISQLQYKDTRLRTYFYEGMEHLSRGYLERTAQYLQRFTKQIGPFPFPEFHIVASPLPVGFGFAGMTYIGHHVLRLPFIKETSLGHEILHNYWGNGVFPDYESGNWAEGLTTYMADYMTAEGTSPAKAKDMRISWLRDYSALPAELDTPVTSFVSKHGQASQVIGYHKVAFIFHMLRQSVGDAAFFKIMQTLWKEKAFKTASWKDIEVITNKVTRQDMSTFYQQWVYQSGAPSFKNISARAQYKNGEGWLVSSNVVQDKPFYQTHLPISVGTGNGILTKKVAIKGPISQGKFWITQRPTALSLDPDFNLFRKLAQTEAPPILRDVMLAKKVDVILAGKAAPIKQHALEIAARMVDGKSQLARSNKQDKTPFILVGLQTDIEDFLSKKGLPSPSLPQKENMTASVWAGKIYGNIPYMVISLKDTKSLKALSRPLPHYGKRSGLIFEGRKAIFKTSFEPRPISVPIH